MATPAIHRVALCSATFAKLSAVKKPSPRSAKNANITMKAAVSGAAKRKSAARPCRFLSMNLSRLPVAPAFGLIGSAAMRRVQQIVLGQATARKLGDDPALFHHHRAIGEGHDFL